MICKPADIIWRAFFIFINAGFSLRNPTETDRTFRKLGKYYCHEKQTLLYTNIPCRNLCQ